MARPIPVGKATPVGATAGESTPRLGELLLERHLITPQQLAAAIAVQQRDQRALGAILVSQQLLTERQLRRTLRWQHWLRQTIAASTVSFSCLTFSCLQTASADETLGSGFVADQAEVGRLVDAAANWRPASRGMSASYSQSSTSYNLSGYTGDSYRAGEKRGHERQRRRFEQDIRDSIGDTMYVFLKGEYSGGVGRYEEGLRYTAKWDDDEIKIDFRYQF